MEVIEFFSAENIDSTFNRLKSHEEIVKLNVHFLLKTTKTIA